MDCRRNWTRKLSKTGKRRNIKLATRQRKKHFRKHVVLPLRGISAARKTEAKLAIPTTRYVGKLASNLGASDAAVASPSSSPPPFTVACFPVSHPLSPNAFPSSSHLPLFPKQHTHRLGLLHCTTTACHNRTEGWREKSHHPTCKMVRST